MLYLKITPLYVIPRRKDFTQSRCLAGYRHVYKEKRMQLCYRNRKFSSFTHIVNLLKHSTLKIAIIQCAESRTSLLSVLHSHQLDNTSHSWGSRRNDLVAMTVYALHERKQEAEQIQWSQAKRCWGKSHWPLQHWRALI